MPPKLTIDEFEDSPLAWICIAKTGTMRLQMRRFPIGYTLEGENKHHIPASILEKMVGPDVPFFTVLRDPYDRNCSEYYFIKRDGKGFYDQDVTNKKTLEALKVMANRIKAHRSIFDKVYAIFSNDMSVEDYLEWCVDNPTYPVYLDTKKPKDLELVGITEHMDQTVDLLRIMYGIKEAGEGVYNDNKTKPVGMPYSTKYPRGEYQKTNAIEYELYYEGKEKFAELCSKYLN
jgi:hypothetical protein